MIVINILVAIYRKDTIDNFEQGSPPPFNPTGCTIHCLSQIKPLTDDGIGLIVLNNYIFFILVYCVFTRKPLFVYNSNFYKIWFTSVKKTVLRLLFSLISAIPLLISLLFMYIIYPNDGNGIVYMYYNWISIFVFAIFFVKLLPWFFKISGVELAGDLFYLPPEKDVIFSVIK